MKSDEKKKEKLAKISELMGGDEPNWNTDKSPPSFIRGLNWYSNQKTYKESKQYLISYMKEMKYSKSDISKVAEVSEAYIKNIGFVCRMRQRGFPVEINHINRIDEKIKGFIENPTEEKVLISSVAVVQQPTQVKEVVQDKTYTQSTNYINEIEGFVDDLLRKKPVNFKPYDYLISSEAKSSHIKQIIEHYTPMLQELSLAYSGNDKEIAEAYSSYKKADLKKILDFVQLVIDDSNRVSSNAKVRVKTTPRKKKEIPVEKKVSKVVYKKEDVGYKLTSINPTNIIGCKQLWIFNTKTKKLGVYVSKDDTGLTVKNSSVDNFDEDKSIQKTLRKPDEILQNVLASPRTALKRVIPTINSVESKLNGRINSETILLKVVK